MQIFEVGSTVKALPESNTWVHQYGVVGVVTDLFYVNYEPLAHIRVPKWLIKRNHGGHIINEWIRNGWAKKGDDALTLDEGIELRHLVLAEMPEQTIDEKVDSLIDQAFGSRGNRLGINVIYYPKDPFVTIGTCVCEGCDKARTRLAWYNNHGTVEAFMVCEGHFLEYNGRCGDGFPFQKN